MARSLAASTPRRSARRPAHSAIGVPRRLAAAAGLVRIGASFLWRRRRLRNALIAVLVALPLLAGGWLLLRDSSLVAVGRVQISGVRGADAGGIDAALSSAARRMTTLDVNVRELRAAVAPFRVVRDLSVSTSFPHGLRIHVLEQPPVAALTVAGVRTAVAADGEVLGPGLLSALLPAISGGWASGHSLAPTGQVEDAAVRAELRVLGAAPHTLLGWVERVFTAGREGLTVAMRGGLLLYFGDATRPHAKWLSAARVLADPSSAGASYVDVRAPERPAAGTTAAGGLEGSAAPAQVSASDPTAAALANTLAEAVRGGSSSSASSAAAVSTPAQVASQPATQGASQAGIPQTTTQETPQAGTAEATHLTTAEPSLSTSG